MPGYRPSGGFVTTACTYQAGDSVIHRLHAGFKLLLTIGLLMAAVYLDGWPWLGLLLAVVIGLYLISGPGWRSLWRDARWLLIQTAVICLLFVIRDGWSAGWEPGLKVGVKILLFFLPGALVLRTSSLDRMSSQIGRWLPRQVNFMVFTSLRFVPFFAREMREIAQAQRLRGAAIGPRMLVKPRNWPDLVNCLLLPLMVRALQTAGEAADSAQARGLKSGGEFRHRPLQNKRKPKS